MRESTSRNQANGSTPHRLQEAMKLRNTAALLPAIIAAKECPVAAAQGDLAIGPFRTPLSISNSPYSRRTVSATH